MVRGETVWADSNRFEKFTFCCVLQEYFDNLNLQGSPLATDCESIAPNFHWHQQGHQNGIPDALHGFDAATQYFSARWTSRMAFATERIVYFSSLANKGSRVFVDGEILVLDSWADCCTTHESDPVTLAEGYHQFTFEYRASDSVAVAPIDSYAEFSWSIEGTAHGAGSDNTNATRRTDELFADVGWLACGREQDAALGTHKFEAGVFREAYDSLVTEIQFPRSFTNPPWVFGTVISVGDHVPAAHLRHIYTGSSSVQLVVELDECGTRFSPAEFQIGWVALAPPVFTNSSHTMQQQRIPTAEQDVAALLEIASEFHLPDYFGWAPGSDPCHANW